MLRYELTPLYKQYHNFFRGATLTASTFYKLQKMTMNLGRSPITA
ncbi:MAG: hypothetical protein O4806_16535 [Trichodesmium sp. St5_bin8]|nr:hypothetical protein [Trichodesmium sp. St5_bin8]